LAELPILQTFKTINSYNSHKNDIKGSLRKNNIMTINIIEMMLAVVETVYG